MNDELQSSLQPVWFALEDYRKIVDIIRGYIRLLRSVPLIPEKETSGERDKRVRILTSVAKRLNEQLATRPTDIQLPLAGEEVEEVIKALMGFVIRIQQIAPLSRERDVIITQVNEWQIRLAGFCLGSPQFQSPTGRAEW